MGWQATVFAAIQAGTTVINADGIFVYWEAPGPNNLQFSFTTTIPIGGGEVTDQFNNHVPYGLTVYGQVSDSLQGTCNNFGFNGFNGYLVNNAGTSSQQSTWNQESTFYQGASDIVTSVPIAAQAPGSGIPSSAETWHPMTLLNGWSLGSGGYARYKLEPNNRVSVQAINMIPGTVTTGTSIWTPPTGYVPTATRQSVACIVENGTETFSADYPRFDAEPTGLMTNNITALMTRVGFNDSYALD